MKRLAVAVLLVVSAGVLEAAPGPPTNLVAQAAGNSLVLSWTAPIGAVVLGYRVRAGTGPGLSNVADIASGPMTQLSAANVPSGTYYLRVSAIDLSGEGPASNEVAVSVGGACTLPAAPAALTGSVSGSSVLISWQAVPGSGITYVLDVGSAPGTSNLGHLIGTTTSMSASAPLGTYYVRVRAMSACGWSIASKEVVLTVGGDGGSGAPPGPTSDAMLRDLPGYIASALASNQAALPRNQHLIAQLTAKIAMLQSPTLAAEITGGQYWFQGGRSSMNGREIPIISMFPQGHLRAEASRAVRLLERTLPMLEAIFNLPLPGTVIRIWQGFVIGNSGGGSTLYMEDQLTYEARTPATRLPYEAILAHELSHTYISHEGLNQFIELYIYNQLQGGSTDLQTWVFTRNYRPGVVSSESVHALLDVYQLIGATAMIDAYRRAYALRPPYGQPLSQTVKDVFINAAPPPLQSQVAERISRVVY
jgi:hypothetical protein